MSGQKTTGLQLLALPTSFGKTYSMCQAISEYVKDSCKAKRTIVFIANSKKHLPADELKKALGKELYARHVLLLTGRVDHLKSVVPILQNEVQDKFKDENFQNMLQLLQQPKTDDNDAQEIGQLSYHLIEKVKAEMKNDGIQGKENIRGAIKEKKKYKWVAKVFPESTIDDFDVILMTTDKLLKASACITNRYRFLSEEFIEDKIFFIDEFDTVKEKITQSLIEEREREIIDLVSLYKDIKRAVKDFRHTKYSQEWQNALDGACRDILENVNDREKDMDKMFNFYLDYKLSEEYAHKDRLFLFYGQDTISIHKMGLVDVLARKDFHVRKNVIRCIPPTERTTEDKNDIDVGEMIRYINGHISYFKKFFLYEWGVNYKNQINSKRKSRAESNHEESYELITADEARRTMIHKITEAQEKIRFLASDYWKSSISTDKERIRRFNNYYEDGFRYFNFKDSNYHLEETHF